MKRPFNFPFKKRRAGAAKTQAADGQTAAGRAKAAAGKAPKLILFIVLAFQISSFWMQGSFALQNLVQSAVKK